MCLHGGGGLNCSLNRARLVELADLHDIQKAFVELLSDSGKLVPEGSGTEGALLADLTMQLDPRRLQVYTNDLAARRLRLARSVYPLTMKLLAHDEKQIVREFWSGRKSTHYNPICELEVFPQFLAKHSTLSDELPFLEDLAGYEWLRRRVHTNSEAIRSSLSGKESIGINSSLVLRRFTYPVHSIAKKVASGSKGGPAFEAAEQYLAVYQDPADRRNLRVQELGRLTFALLERFTQGKLSGGDLIQESIDWLHRESAQPQTMEEARTSIQCLFQDLTGCGILLRNDQ